MAKPPIMAHTPVDSPQLFSPDFSFEQALIDKGDLHICGLDEAGRGPLAGPVVAAAVILNPNNIPAGLNDSKKLSVTKRETLYEEIMELAEICVASVSAHSIDKRNIRAASLYAMALATNGLATRPHHALIDGNALPEGLPCPATAIVKGDARSVSIAAASIIAKVTRDKMMVRAGRFYPGYGLEGHKGYPTKAHREAVFEIGPTRFHRQSFAPVRDAAAKHK